MIIELKSLYSGDRREVVIDTKPDLSGVEFGGVNPFSDVAAKGAVRVSAEMVLLEAVVSYVYHGVCSRCLAPFEQKRAFQMSHVLCEAKEGENRSDDYGENADIITVEDDRLDFDALVTEDLILDIPSKVLCKPDCRGLCIHCGQDQNQSLCGCRPEKTDPRLAVLKTLLEDED